MLKVHILDRCPYCNGEGMVFAGKDTYYDGRQFDRYRPCAMCHGSGEYPKWISLTDLRELLEIECPHEHVSTNGSTRFSAGDVWDDIETVCDDCGMT